MRKKKEIPKVRINVVVPEMTRETIDKLVERTGADNVSEVIRVSVKYYDALTRGSRPGDVIRIILPDGEEHETVV